MYSPQYALEADPEKINEVIAENPFATITYVKDGKAHAFHLPLVKSGEKLIGHLAKANFAWNDLDGSDALVIFHGPHCYISPTWYGSGGADVPTWNYISVHIRGPVIIHQDEHFLKEALVKFSHQQNPDFKIAQNIQDHAELLKAIVGIEIDIKEVLAKFKLAQRKDEKSRMNVIEKLEKSEDSMDHKVAKAMKKTMGT